MSRESYPWLSKNVLAGFKDTRRPWWADAAEREGNALNLFPAEVPMSRVEELIASWAPYSVPVYDAKEYDGQLFDADMKPITVPLYCATELTTHKLIKASDDGSRMTVIGIDHAIHNYGDWLSGTVKECVGDEAQVSSAGLLRRRNQAWVQIERPETAVGPDGIMFSPYVTLSTSLDGSLASQINQNTQMTICDNTLQITRGQGLAVRHTKNSGGKLGAYRGVMTAIMQGETDFRAELERQLKVDVSDSDFSRFLDSFVPISEDDVPAKKTRSERKRQEITQLYRNDPRVMNCQGTEFGVVQAVNTWRQHMSQLKNSTGIELDDTNLRAMRNYGERMRISKGDTPDMLTVKMLESVLV